MLKRALWTAWLLVGPLWATAAPCCHLKSSHAASAARFSASAQHACCSGPSHAVATSNHATACAGVPHTSDAVAAASNALPQATVATRGAAPVAPKPAPEPAHREASPRIGPLFLSHQALLL